MKIEVWSDFVCPFCYIGKRRLEEALSSFPHRENVEIIFRSFELDPDVKKETPLNIHEMIAQKYGISVDEAKRANADIGKQAEALGLTFRFETMKPTNTFDAHRLAQYAKKKGKLHEVVERLFYAYFTESKQISDRNVLLELAEAAGLDRKEAEVVLDDGRYAEQVRHEEAIAAQLGVRGVPFFVLNQKYAISGAQPVEVFRQAIERVWTEEQQSSSLQSLAEEGKTCTDENCTID
ncbi:protein disulfide-isomerase [Anoxybacillus mongoliensis]|uniref:Protein disulfide-isomerase n=1 Tax=Anoxybacillus mongoliensis TaxID=452565 RepID=A0A7W8JDR2_9BACL|nr:DsbA family oxidoreductase [Anoxybacillus mongoliensis]MBB5354790.1 protein disulfide-isomerase [Anoxybacillus mongoliensis]